jgi:hypothetical protein
MTTTLLLNLSVKPILVYVVVVVMDVADVVVDVVMDVVDVAQVEEVQKHLLLKLIVSGH